MQITMQDEEVGVRQPTVSKNTSLGREFYRSATWQEGDTTVTVTVIAFVTGIRARKNPDGSVDFLDQVTRFDVLRGGEFIQHVERAVFLWDRHRLRPDGETDQDWAIDRTDGIGENYAATLEDAEQTCRIFVNSLDFDNSFDPAAWV